MLLVITPRHTLQDVQKKIREYFQYLKIDFYRSIVTANGELHNTPVAKDARISEPGINYNYLNIPANLTPGKIESLFYSNLKLLPKIYRKTQTGWLDITNDNTTSLQRHNWVGRDASNAIFDFELL